MPSLRLARFNEAGDWPARCFVPARLLVQSTMPPCVGPIPPGLMYHLRRGIEAPGPCLHVAFVLRRLDEQLRASLYRT